MNAPGPPARVPRGRVILVGVSESTPIDQGFRQPVIRTDNLFDAHMNARGTDGVRACLGPSGARADAGQTGSGLDVCHDHQLLPLCFAVLPPELLDEPVASGARVGSGLD